MSEISLTRFLEDVKGHSMEVLLDQDVYRHLRFSNNGDVNLSFSLVTFPGRLVYTGDMGTFVFFRVCDMFQFFRQKPECWRTEFGYWHEKLLAVDHPDGSKQKSKTKFEAVLRSYLDGLADPDELSDADDGDESSGLRVQIEEGIIEILNTYDTYGFDRAFQDASDFCVGTPNKPIFQFCDLWDHYFDEFTVRFEWACYAIQWGIKQYDLAKAEVAA